MDNTLFFATDSLSPAKNLALEESLLINFRKTGADRILMLWRNGASVIIGRNQNAFAEVDLALADREGIPVVRRTTGGGAVFHDPGNINYSVIMPAGDEPAGRAECSLPMIRALRKLGIDAGFSGRNDILFEGKKISGSAQRVAEGVLLHHGTLLWSADLGRLSALLKPDREKLESKGIRSVSSRVGNLREMLPAGSPLRKLDGEGFFGLLRGVFSEEFGLSEPPEEIAAAAKKLEAKYLSWDWNRGRSPAFSNTVSRRFPFGRITAGYEADRGRLTLIRFTGDFLGDRPVSGLEERLTGLRLTREDLSAALRGSGAYFSCSDEEASAAVMSLLT